MLLIGVVLRLQTKNIDLTVEIVNDNSLPQMTMLKQEMENISCKLIRFKVKKGKDDFKRF